MIETVYHRTPADEIIDREEKTGGWDEVRAAREKCLELLNAFAVEIEDALNRPEATLSEVATAFYAPCFALGLMAIGNVSMTEIAARFAITRAAISKRAVNFCRMHGLPASWSMKRDESRTSYRQAREDVVKENSNQ